MSFELLHLYWGQMRGFVEFADSHQRLANFHSEVSVVGVVVAVAVDWAFPKTLYGC